MAIDETAETWYIEGKGIFDIGNANDLIGVNADRSGLEYKTLLGVSNRISVSHSAKQIQLSTPQDLHIEASPTFAGLTLTDFSGVLKAIDGLILGEATTSDLPEGSNLYWTQARFDTAFSGKTTDNLTEGTTNFYCTDARVRASISATAPIIYNSTTGVIGLTIPLAIGYGGTGLSAIGANNQLLGVNAEATALEYKNISSLLTAGTNIALSGITNVTITTTEFIDNKSIRDVTTTGLVLAMNFNPETLVGTAGSEVVLDSSGYNNHGQNYGATALPTGGFNGGGALSFNGVSNYVDCGNDASLFPTDVISMEAWVYMNANQDGAVLGSRGAINATSGGAIYIENMLANFSLVINGVWRSSDGISISLETWTHLVGVYDGSRLYIYKDGNLGSSTPQTGSITQSNEKFTIGKEGARVGYYFNGRVDEPRIYRRGLTSDEVKQLYLQRKEIYNSFVSQKDIYVNKVRVSTQFDKTADITLANISGLSANLVAGKSYKFTVNLFVNANATGGHKYAMSGTATATNVIYQINSISNTTNLNVINSRQTALGGSAGQTGATIIHTVIEGFITVNIAGTLTCQFAQNVASGTSSVLVGSNMIIEQIL